MRFLAVVDLGDAVIPSADRMSRFASDDPTPEDLLIQREEIGEDDEPDEPGRRPLMSPEEIEAMLARLPAQERDAVVAYYAGEQRQRDTAARVGCSQPSVHNRIQRGIQRLRWIASPAERPELAGPGSWFTTSDIERDLRGAVSRAELAALVVYWRSTFVRTVQEHLFMRTHADAWRLLHGAIRKLSGRYRDGFDAAVKRGKWLLAHEAGEPSAVEDFLRTRCAFVHAGRVARLTLLASYERHARERRRRIDAGALVDAVRARGARPITVVDRVTGDRMRGFAGIALSPQQGLAR